MNSARIAKERLDWILGVDRSLDPDTKLMICFDVDTRKSWTKIVPKRLQGPGDTGGKWYFETSVEMGESD